MNPSILATVTACTPRPGRGSKRASFLRRGLRAVTAGVSLLVAASDADANDAEFANHGGDVAPVTNTKVRMVSEDIHFQQTEAGWKVRAAYRFANTEDTDVRLTMGFPEILGDGEGDRSATEFAGLRTRVEGKLVKHRVERSVSANPWKGRPLGRVHLFDVTFAAKQTLEVVHAFEMGASTSVALVPEEELAYITVTGALWAGPIGHARFTVDTIRNYDLVAWPKSYTLASATHHVQDGRHGRRLVLEMRDWVPTEDLTVRMAQDMFGECRQGLVDECPTPRNLGLEPPAPRDVATLAEFSVEVLRMCRNHVYARHGRPFEDPKLQAHFYPPARAGAYPFWVATTGDVVDDFGWPATMIGLVPNPSFSPNMLSRDDARYVEALLEEERRREEGEEPRGDDVAGDEKTEASALIPAGAEAAPALRADADPPPAPERSASSCRGCSTPSGSPLTSAWLIVVVVAWRSSRARHPPRR